ncbi:BsuBI/PstI family type II restriction endonuclease [Mucilaginibacter sp. 44-25]|uniref:BsuBI/PstI family type II restriction endonuclease n=1 Tax=Mucilaginibacter sp. 44-25 TaxID=1895794 RepID=UPI00095CBFC1|nr:BsuBI/PstI family type II restriction endonuclease [Mucilaginibacter sp. 44-25]OJW12630.1 MAG: restriction endonuclease [Mucilaginibacter sp. 44-25]
MKDYLPKSKKSPSIKKIINEAIDILDSIGLPVISKTERSREKMAMSFLALLGVTNQWSTAKCVTDNYGLSSKEIINFFNKNFEDNISAGSYDDVPRDYIKLLLVTNFVVKSGINPNENYNSPTRKYVIPTFIKDLVIKYGTEEWPEALTEFKTDRVMLVEQLKRKRDLNTLPVLLPSGESINFSVGSHNELQKAIIEEFLPRFGAGSKVLYVGDGANKSLWKLDSDLQALNFFDISHGILPDVVAYSEEKNWLYLIEAFYSTGTISEVRMIELKANLKNCKAEIIYITAFLTKEDFKKNILDIAWESEVWTADNPDHMVHFNGHKFLGAYSSNK